MKVEGGVFTPKKSTVRKWRVDQEAKKIRHARLKAKRKMARKARKANRA